MTESFLIAFSDSEGRQVVIEDDGSVCYAYLFVADRQAKSLVWLYNRLPAPLFGPQWEAEINQATERVPLNADRYTCQVPFKLPCEEDIHVVWHPEDRAVAIYIRDELHAILEEYEPTGWCTRAKTDGPLARVLYPTGGDSESRSQQGRADDAPLQKFRNGDITVLIEKDARVCYAYMYERSDLLSYVWLYNRTASGSSGDAEPVELGPAGRRAVNPAPYVLGDGFEEPLEKAIDVIIRSDQKMTGIYFNGRLHALMQDGCQPGRCVLAERANSLAVPMG